MPNIDNFASCYLASYTFNVWVPKEKVWVSEKKVWVPRKKDRAHKTFLKLAELGINWAFQLVTNNLKELIIMAEGLPKKPRNLAIGNFIASSEIIGSW